MANMFRLLRADEIDARVGTAKSGGKGISLLLYKDARCDQNILDETVGPFNWQRSHNRDNANCVVSIWDGEKKQWISKEDTGTESNTEKEKGLASDSFKRACFNWGIGRELYSAPFIWIRGDPEKLKFEKFSVAEIGYNESREINKLAIADKSGALVYRFGNVTVNHMPIRAEELPEDAMQPKQSGYNHTLDAWAVSHQGMFDPQAEVEKWCETNGVSKGQFGGMRKALIEGKIVPDKPIADLQAADFDNLVNAMRANFWKQESA